MRGLPFKATEGDIIKFFSPILPKMVEIHLEGARKSGEATVEFNSHEDALQAMEKDKEYMGGLTLYKLYPGSCDTCTRAFPTSNFIVYSYMRAISDIREMLLRNSYN